MKVTRKLIVNGNPIRTEFELNETELALAYQEYQSIADKCEVTARLQEMGYEKYDEVPEELIAELAGQFRQEMDTISYTMGDGRIPAMESVFKKNAEKLEEYKTRWRVFSKTINVTVFKTYYIKAKSEIEAETLFDKWRDQNVDSMCNDFAGLIDYDGEWDEDSVEEATWMDPEDADIKEDE